MDWSQQVIAYCERGDFSYWSEPVNAVTNAAFLVAAAVMYARLRGQGPGLAMALVAVLAMIGIGSFLWHTHATRWAGLMDVLPILVFILVYVFAATRDFLGLAWYWAGLAVLLFFPYAAGFSWAVAQLVPAAGANAAYASVALLIVLYGLWLHPRAPDTARGLFVGAGVLAVSLGFRMLDGFVCEVFPLGTHFMWHILNAVMLGWMIEVYRRHMLAGRARQG